MKDNKVKSNLEEKFKQLLPNEDAPEELKQEVFDTIDTLTLIGDIAELFTSKFSSAESQLLDMLQKREEDE